MSAAAGNSGSVREVRIALVCYGGVSLAIYMHGVTRELHRLVVASSRFDEVPNPFKPSCSEHVYWELLHELAAKDGVQTRVVVDVISGTSAGGINGVFLAKAVAHDLSQQSLRDLWFKEADISKLAIGQPLASHRVDRQQLIDHHPIEQRAEVTMQPVRSVRGSLRLGD